MTAQLGAACFPRVLKAIDMTLQFSLLAGLFYLSHLESTLGQACSLEVSHLVGDR